MAQLQDQQPLRVEPNAAVTFAQDVQLGLSAEPKRLPSKHLYDAQGSELFIDIMELEGYYPTKAETDCLQRNAEAIADTLGAGPFRLVDLGVGDGLKTRIVLEELMRRGVDFEFVPADISKTQVELLLAEFERDYGDKLRMTGHVGDHFEALEWLNSLAPLPLFVLFLGGNIGNYDPSQADSFVNRIRYYLRPGDTLITGFDLKKAPRTILAAYDDPKGVTASFNLNILRRINRELQGDFDVEAFEFFPQYNPLTGELRSHLISRRKQQVNIGALNRRFQFEAWEPIHTESSYKFNYRDIERLANRNGFHVLRHFTDNGERFTDSCWQAPH